MLFRSFVQRAEGVRGVATASAEAGGERNVFLEVDSHTVSDPGGLEEGGGGFVDEVTRVHGECGLIAGEREAGRGAGDGDLVAQRHGLHDGLQLMIAILPLAEDVEQEVDLAGRLADDGVQTQTHAPMAGRAKRKVRSILEHAETAARDDGHDFATGETNP